MDAHTYDIRHRLVAWRFQNHDSPSNTGIGLDTGIRSWEDACFSPLDDVWTVLVAQATAIKIEQAHCLALRAPTPDLWLEITKSRKFVIQGFAWIA
jgi:hypothetical protein